MKRTLLEIINQVFDNNGMDNIKVLNDSDSLINDLGFDSFLLAELTVNIENDYGIDIFESSIIKTIIDIKLKLNE